MSASREKQNRQEQVNSGQVNPKTVREAQQRKEEKRTSTLYMVIGVAFLVLAVAAVIYRSNIIPKSTTAVTIDGEKYTAGETDFYFQNAYRGFLNNQNVSYMISYLGLDTSTPLKDQTISEEAAGMMATMGFDDAEKDQTWYDFFLNQAVEQMAKAQGGLKQAAAEGFEYPASVQEELDASMESLRTAAQGSGVSVNAYLAGNFGPLINEKIYKEQVRRMLQLEAYSDNYLDGLTYSDAELESAYAEDPNSYDRVAYEYVSISGAAPSTTDEEGNTVEPTEEESAAALEAAETAANRMLSDLRAGDRLEMLAETDESYSYANVDSGTYSGSALSEWLFDSARKAGDSDVIESGATYYVAVFHDRFREEYNTVNIRHILIQPEAGTLTSEDEGYEAEQEELKAAAKARAEDILAQWKAGEATEDSFAALAMEESSDGSRYDGGLYSQVTQGQMVQAFNDWCFDASRQPGDTGVVETQYGYHVMYFSGTDLPAWEAAVSDTLKSEDYTEWEDALDADVSVTRSDSGLKYVG